MSDQPNPRFSNAIDTVRAGLLVNGLAGLAGTPARIRATTPNKRPDQNGLAWVRLQLGGGISRNRLQQNPLITIEAWAPDQMKAMAHDLGQECGHAIRALQGTTVAGIAIGRVVEVSGLLDFPDPTAHVPRFVQKFTVAMRGITSTEGA